MAHPCPDPSHPQNTWKQPWLHLFVAMILSPSLLASPAIAQNKFDELEARLKQVGAMKDQNALTRIAITEEYPLVRAKALSLVTAQTNIAKIAIESQGFDTALTASRRVRDPALLEKVAMESKHANSRMIVYDKLSDEAQGRVATRAKHEQMRSYAAGKLTDLNLLSRMAASDKDESVRKRAADRIKQLEDQIEKTIKDASLSAADGSRLKRAHRLNDQAELARLATTDPIVQIRLATAGRVTDQAVLKKIMLEEKEEMVRLTALRRVEDQALLAQVASKDPSQLIRNLAALRIKDKEERE